MASNKVSLVLVLDVGRNMNMPSNTRGCTFFDLAIEGIQWIITRKIFSESKDDVGLVVFGSDKTENRFASVDKKGEYRNIEVVREPRQADIDLLKYVENEVKVSDSHGDFLSALIVALDLLQWTNDGKKVGEKTIVLLSNLGGHLHDEEHAALATAINAANVELTIIGTDVGKRTTDEHSESGLNKKSAMMIRGELVLDRLLRALSHRESYSLSDAVEKLTYFINRQVKPIGWKCDLQIGEQVQIPLYLYIKTKKATVRQTWKLYDPSNHAEVQMERVYERTKFLDELKSVRNNSDLGAEQSTIHPEEARIEKENLVKGYKFGTTLVPFSDADQEALKFRPGGKCFMILGFTKRNQIYRQYLIGDSVHYALPNPDYEKGCVAFSALVEAMLEDNIAAIVRYVYNARSAPKLGVLIPKQSNKGPPMLVYVQLPFSQDVRAFVFPEFTVSTDPDGSELAAVDRLVDDMDLNRAHVVDDDTGQRGEWLRPRQVMDPYIQRVFECLKYRALYGDQPLPSNQSRIVKEKLEPSKELRSLAVLGTDTIKEQFNLVRMNEGVKSKKIRLPAAQIFRNVEQTSIGGLQEDKSQSAGEYLSKTIGTVDPVSDFNCLLLSGQVSFVEASDRLVSVVHSLVPNEADLDKAVQCMFSFRLAAIQYGQEQVFNQQLIKLKQDTSPSSFSILLQKKVWPIGEMEDAMQHSDPVSADDHLIDELEQKVFV